MNTTARVLFVAVFAMLGWRLVSAQQIPAWGSGEAPFALALSGDMPYGPSREPAFERVVEEIPPDKRHLLFKPFSQVDASTSRRYGGTGLGLAICDEIIKRMGGSISVESEVGRGTTFTIELDLPVSHATEREAPVQPHRAAARSALSRSTPLRVLLAEDNAVNQLVAVRLLERCGCAVEAVSDGEAAIAALASSDHHELVLMDCEMPHMDGFEATRRIRAGEAGARARTLPIIALTASATVENQASCIAAGMDEFLTKPVTPQALERGLARWLRRGEAEWRSSG
jgi:CheY-like chemotaxis protein